MKQRLGLIALFAVQIISGINSPLIRFALQSMPIYLFGFLRVGIALLIIGPIALARRHRRPAKEKTIKRSDLFMIIVGSLLIYCTANLAFYQGIHRSTSINAAIIGLVGPIVFFMVNIEMFKERFNAKIFAGIGLAFMGSALVVIGPLAGRAGNAATGLAGNIFLLISILTEIAGIVILKKVLSRVHVLDVLAIGLAVSTLVYGVLAGPQFADLRLLNEPAIRNAVLYGGIMMGCIGTSLGYFGLSATKGSDYSIMGYLQPVVAMFVAASFFHETFTPSLIVGGGIVFFGLYLVEARNLVRFHAARIHSK